MTNIALYSTIDLPNCIRLHKWGSGDSAKYAIGNGPIEYITKEKFEQIMQDSKQNNNNSGLDTTQKCGILY